MEIKNIKILAIDDNKDNLFTLKVLIKEFFSEAVVLTALSGKEGLNIAALEEPHLILLDVIMPKMDGFEVCKILKANKKLRDIPVVFVTALGAKEDRIKALENGGEGFISKPIEESELVAQIRVMLKLRIAALEKQSENERLEALVVERTKNLKKELVVRRQAEEELEESEGLSKSITQTASDAIICINSDGFIKSWNLASEKIFGYAFSEMINNNLDILVPNQHKTSYINALNSLKKGDKATLFGKLVEIEALRKDRTEFPIELSFSSWEGVDNQKYYTGIVRDISRRKRIEAINTFKRMVFKKLAEGNSLDSILDFIVKKVEKQGPGVMCSILLVDKSGTHLTLGAAPTFPKFYKDAIEGIEIKHGNGSCGTAAFTKERVIVKDIQTHPYWKNFKELAKKANLHSCWSEPIIGKNGKVLGAFAIYHNYISSPSIKDIASVKEFVNILTIAIERKFTEEELKKLSIVVEQSSNSIVITDTEGNIEYINPKFTKVTGYTPEEVLGKNPKILNSGLQSKKFYVHLWQSISMGKTWKGELRNKSKSGKLFWEQETISPIKNNTGKIVNYIAVKEDITSLKENQQLLQKQNKELLLTGSELLEKNKMLLESENRFKNLFNKSSVALLEENYAEVKELLLKKKLEGKNLKTYLDENPAFVAECISKIKIISVNQNMLDLFGAKNKEEVLNLLIKTLNKEAIEVLKKELLLVVSTKKVLSIEAKFFRANGHEINTILKLAKIDNLGNVSISLTDITSIKNVENKLVKAKEKAEKSDKRYKLVVAATDLGIWDWYVDSEDIYFSKLWKEQIGYTESELENKFSTWKNHLHPEEYDEVNKALNDYIKNPKGQYISEFRFRHKNGSYIWIHTRAEVLKNKKGKVVRMFGSHRDISAIKITELKLKEKNRELIKAKEKAEESDQLKTEFLNNMSHEIRTPLNGILGFSKFLNDSDLGDAKRATFVNIIQNSGKQLLHIIDDILEISELETKQVKVVEEKFCLNNVLFELFSIFDIKAKENKTPLYLKKELSDKQSTITTDRTKLIKIISNLLENSLKFTNKGFIELGYQVKGKELEIYVKDTGIGIASENHKTIFKRFSQAEKDLSKKVGGLGLGLSIVKENTELLGGKIRLESKKGEGTHFFITIPYKPVFTADEITEVAAVAPKNKYTILIAEDEEVNYLYLEALLKDIIKLNCNLIHVKNGLEAVEFCKQTTTIDLILMDLKMPVMSGFEATKHIKKLFPAIPIIAQTAYSTSKEKEKALFAGCDAFISKPITKDSFKFLIEKYINYCCPIKPRIS